MYLPRRQLMQLRSFQAGRVHLVVGFPPGGPTDYVARLTGQRLSDRFGQPYVIENRPGAGSNLAAEAVIKSPPDGYTLLLVASANAINATLYDKLNFNFVEDIAAVAGISRQPFVMVVNQSVPVASSCLTAKAIRIRSTWLRPAMAAPNMS